MFNLPFSQISETKTCYFEGNIKQREVLSSATKDPRRGDLDSIGIQHAQNFQQPLLVSSFSSNAVITTEKARAIFGNVVDIRNFHARFCNALEEIITAEPSTTK
jgi:hypothetical protein